MDLKLAHKKALVTGASSGIGAATARLLAQEGADVIVCYGHNETGAAETLTAVKAHGVRGWLSQMDVGDPKQVQAEMARIGAIVEALDVLVLCAGSNQIAPLEEVTTEAWQRVLDVNLNGVFFVLQAALPLLREGSAVVTVSSVAAHTGAPHHAHYAAAKAGVINLTKSAARALGPGVRVNCVAPGITKTPMGQDTIDHLPDDYAQRKLLSDDFASPEEIARCIVFLASPTIGFVTGATLDANGGRILH
jgi:3-oxoacyl-[acyl-carrier protein] reductase